MGDFDLPNLTRVVDRGARRRTHLHVPPSVPSRILFGVALVSGSLLMTELSLTRIFSVTMYYHFAFMAISIALFGLSASGVYVFLLRDKWRNVPSERLLAAHAFAYAAVTVLALTVLPILLTSVRAAFRTKAPGFAYAQVYGCRTRAFAEVARNHHVGRRKRQLEVAVRRALDVDRIRTVCARGRESRTLDIERVAIDIATERDVERTA